MEIIRSIVATLPAQYADGHAIKDYTTGDLND
jgi:hypothetical protein